MANFDSQAIDRMTFFLFSQLELVNDFSFVTTKDSKSMCKPRLLFNVSSKKYKYYQNPIDKFKTVSHRVDHYS
jgi:hypothetical protein